MSFDITNRMKLLIKIIQTKIYSKNKNNNLIPYKVNFDVTYRCNLKCSICNIWERYHFDADKLKEELTLKEYEKIFEKYSKNLFLISFEGGEPFLRDDLSKIVISAKNKCPNLNSILIASNGYLSENIVSCVKKILKNIENVPLYIALSLDGFENTHDNIRGVAGSFKNVLKTFSLLKKINNKNLNFFFQTTICKSNWTELLELKKEIDSPFIYTLAQDGILFNNMKFDENVQLIEDKLSFLNFIKNLSDSIHINSVESFLNKIYLNLSHEYLENRISPINCVASIATLSFDPYGNVKPCAFMKEELGNIRNTNYDISSLLRESINLSQLRELIKKKNCPNCWMNCDALPSIINFLPEIILSDLRKVI